MRLLHSACLFFLVLAMITLSACQPAASTELATEYIPVSIEGAEGVIVPANMASEFELAEQYWTPSEEDVLKLENSLPAYLEQVGATEVAGRLPEYKRQYVGFTFDGDQLIYGNFFCNPLNYDWQKEAVFVLDGGSCYFQIQYDPKNDQFLYLQINGEA